VNYFKDAIDQPPPNTTTQPSAFPSTPSN
jgi:hypothetical protein